MKISNQLHRWLASAMVILGLTAWTLPAARVYAAEGNKSNANTKMMDRCRHRLAMREKMLDQMKARDAELEKMVAKMNKAPESKKVDLMAAIVTQMVRQRHQMLERMEGVNARILQRMNRHMEMSKNRMPARPMMNGQKGQG